MRSELERLAAAAESDPEFLETPLVRMEGAADSSHAEGERIGPYRLIRPLGRGGMGEVFLATQEDADFERYVAIKVIRRGLDTDDVLARFRSERRILASLAHPNIATLLDGGATLDGRPFFVMEYVEGEPLDRYCDRALLSIPERLRLFMQVCAAVHNAHQNLVVHRDLKPSNVLITADGVPKLLDFGIAKLLDAPGNERTRVDQRVLTPDYAAPEQIAGAAVTTASDVYSLGVILYQLVTGHLPFDRRPAAEVDPATSETRIPLRPSDAVSNVVTRELEDGSTETLTPEHVSMLRSDDPGRLRRRLSGDLDTIVLRALSSEPERRYGSALALAEDLERHLKGLPVVARPDTLAYRASSFVRRNRVGVGASAAIVVLLAGSTVLSVVQARRIEAEANRARAERDKAVEVRGFLLETFGTTGADKAAGDSVTVGALLDGRLATLEDEFGAQPETLAEMQAVLAEGYRRLGRLAQADSLARAALELREQRLGPNHVDVAASLNTLGLVLHEAGRSADAEPLLERAVEIWRNDEDARVDELARALNDLGLVREELAEFEAAGTAYEASLALREASGRPQGRGRAVTTSNLAALRYSQGRFEEAVTLGSQAVDLLRTTVGPDHRRSLVAQNNLAVMRQVAGDLDGAAAEYQDILDRRVRILGASHPDVAGSRRALASMLLQTGQPAEAEAQLRDAFTILQGVGTTGSSRAAGVVGLLARAVAAQGRMDEASVLNDSALVMLRRLHPEGHPNLAAQASLSAAHLRSLGETEAALRLHREAVAIAERVLGASHPQVAAYLSGMGRTFMEAGRSQDALPHVKRALDVFRASLGETHARSFQGRLMYASVLAEVGEVGVADSLVAAARAELAAAPDSVRSEWVEQAERGWRL